MRQMSVELPLDNLPNASLYYFISRFKIYILGIKETFHR